MEWIKDSLGHSCVGKGVARLRVIPIVGVFIACVFIGRLQMQDDLSLTDGNVK